MYSEKLTSDNFVIYAAKHYDNPQCASDEEFIEDVKRIRYIKKLITRYEKFGELKERLILNHLIVLTNIFGPEHLCKMLYLKMEKQMKFVKPFLILLNVLPKKIYNVGDKLVIDTDTIELDSNIVNLLRVI